nr:MAG TPA: hypothetical protein [Caudoviricetes sp.]
MAQGSAFKYRKCYRFSRCVKHLVTYGNVHRNQHRPCKRYSDRVILPYG